MNFDLLDQNVSLTTNVFLIIANIINLIYNVPQMIKTYKTKSTSDFSTVFLILRIIGNTIWIEYAIEVNSFLMLINNIVTVVASIFISYYKFIELYPNLFNKSYIYQNRDNNDENEIDYGDNKDVMILVKKS